ncbi:hypothetical protein QFC24_006226 [Naganishia onofrii]|uniref:Uncharacterized protein n=1 Tax=Naganishia onofrii TaxID=1851511 RepID=A0ACC2X6M1_9TREE|nr:hypothetical protein QFC24_006226 [Naganishia onofrii]
MHYGTQRHVATHLTLQRVSSFLSRVVPLLAARPAPHHVSASEGNEFKQPTSIGELVSLTSARLSVTNNQIVAVSLVAPVVVLTLYLANLPLITNESQKLLAPRLEPGEKISFRDRSMDYLIDEKVAEGKLSLDNVMSIRTKTKISMDTLGSLDSVIYRLKLSKRISDEKNTSDKDCFYDDNALRALVTTMEAGDIHITDGVLLSSASERFFNQGSDVARPREIIANVNHHNKTMRALERMIVRYGYKSQSHVTLKESVEDKFRGKFKDAL